MEYRNLNIGELTEILMELPADAKVQGIIKWDEQKEVLTVQRSTRKGSTTQKTNVMDKLTQPGYELNVNDLVRVWGELYKQKRGTSVRINFPKDIGIMKRVFPSTNTYGEIEVKTLETYLDIFDTQIKTGTYLTPTLGGLPYAMNKVSKAMGDKIKAEKQQELAKIDTTGEVF